MMTFQVTSHHVKPGIFHDTLESSEVLGTCLCILEEVSCNMFLDMLITLAPLERTSAGSLM